VNGGYYSKDRLGNPCDPYLIPDIARFSQPGRRVVLAFDQDSKPETVNRVNGALSRFGWLLEKAGCNVAIASWKPSQGKGVDDLIVNCGAAAWDSAYSEAWELAHWQIAQRLNRQLTWESNLKVRTKDLSTLDPAQVPESGIVAISSGKGTGKTKAIAQLRKNAGFRHFLFREIG
jgi:Domain of unknown function (DUF3854)